jgi:hypothetical protein
VKVKHRERGTGEGGGKAQGKVEVKQRERGTGEGGGKAQGKGDRGRWR